MFLARGEATKQSPADESVVVRQAGDCFVASLLVLPVIDFAVDVCVARAGNSSSICGNSPVFPDHRTNRSIGPIHRRALPPGRRVGIFLTYAVIYIDTHPALCYTPRATQPARKGSSELVPP